MYLIGYDIGSSSVKACVVDAQTGKTLSTAFYPKQEAPILSLKAGWAEQEPESWWNYLKSATAEAMAAAAEKETAAAQARLTASVVKEARNLASKIQYDSLVPMWLLALICLLAYGSLMLWAGFRIDTGRDMPLAAVLHMPSGWLISGLCLAAGVFCGALTAKGFAEAKRGWWKNGGIAVLFIMLGTLLFSLSLSRLG